MGRPRVTGILVLGAALVALAVLPNLSSRAISGAATQAPVPGPPAVGDCVIRRGTSPWSPLDTTSTVPGTRSYAYPRLEISRCTGSRFGEVVKIIPHPVKPSITVSADGGISEINDPNLDSCQAAAGSTSGCGLGNRQVQRRCSPSGTRSL